jgi:hypothetical protein
MIRLPKLKHSLSRRRENWRVNLLLIGLDMLRPLIPVQSVRRLKLELPGDRHGSDFGRQIAG